VSEFLYHRRNSELLECRDFGWNEAEDSSVPIRLFQVVTAKTGSGIHFVGEIEIAALIENCPAAWIADLRQHGDRLLASDRLLAQRDNVAVLPHLGRLPFAEMKIGPALLDDGFQEFVYCRHF
jgi:hypothetical protein